MTHSIPGMISDKSSKSNMMFLIIWWPTLVITVAAVICRYKMLPHLSQVENDAGAVGGEGCMSTVSYMLARRVWPSLC